MADPVKKCRCELPRPRQGHAHAWLSLLDNIGNTKDDGGQRFLEALIRARQQLDTTTGHDPLLVVAAVDEWTPVLPQPLWCSIPDAVAVVIHLLEPGPRTTIWTQPRSRRRPGFCV